MKQVGGKFTAGLNLVIFIILYSLCVEAEMETLTNTSGGKSDMILYDMSTVVHGLKNTNQNKILVDNWKPKSSHIYIGSSDESVAIIVNGNASTIDLLSLSAYLNPFKEKNMPIFLAHQSTVLDSIIIPLFSNPERCDCSPNISKNFSKLVLDHLKKYQNKSVKTGVELTDHILNCCNEQQEFKPLHLVDYTVLKIQLTSSMLSYGLFLDAVTERAKKFANFVRRFNTNCTLYIRPVISGWENVTSEQAAYHYDALGIQYVKAWINENEHKGEENYIMRYSSSNFTAIGNNQFFKEKVTPTIFMGKYSIFNESCYQPLAECGKILKIVSSLFDNTLLVNPSLTFVAGYRQFVSENKPQSSSSSKATTTRGLTNVLIKNSEFNREKAEILIRQLVDSKPAVNLNIVYIDSGYKGISQMKNDLNRMHLKGTKIGCYLEVRQNRILLPDDMSSLVSEINEQCSDLSEMSSHILMSLTVHIRTHEDLMKLLVNLYGTKANYENKYAGETVVPMIRIVGVGRGPSSVSFSYKKPVNVSYCNPRLKLLNEFHQAILTFGRMHQWNELVLLPAVNSYQEFVLWRNVETDFAIDRSSTNFPVLFRSNAEKPIDDNDNLPFTYPCINWTEKADRAGMKFHDRQYSGTTFSAKLRSSPPITPVELQQALHFALSRFPFVEICDVNEQEFRQQNSVVHQFGFNRAKTSRRKPPISSLLIYFQISIYKVASLREDIGKLMAQSYSAVHISDWENGTEQVLNSVVPLVASQTNSSAKFGITVENCNDEMNMELVKIKSLPFINKVGYVVCNVKSVLPNNINKMVMQTYLDTIFYTKSYMEHSLSVPERNVEVMFRINLNSICPDVLGYNRDVFLRFINDVSQHGAAFQIKYFIVKAYESEQMASNCPNTWWRITNYTELTNNLVYVDRESEFIGRRKTSPKIKPSPPPEANSTVPHVKQSAINYKKYFYTILLPIAGLLVVAVFLLWFQRRYYETRFLTQREVNQFYKPSLMSSDNMPLVDNDGPNSAYIQFPTKYEISARDLDIKEEIGRGQFGVVHEGILKKKTPVAIKIPIANCSKEEFMSALAELKILCYVGSHPNIVSFLGAHTKNIRRGKLMMVIEYCGKGALEDYIRGFNTADCRVDLNQLYEFAHQIAAGMEHLAEKRIIHGDLATRNVLLTDDFTCKISDFGLSRRLYEVSVYVKRGNEALPWMWMAIESLKDMEFTTKSDVWSYAVTLWEIFTLGQLPYPGRRLTQGFIMELESGTRMERAPLASDQIHQKMLQCWSLEQDDRPTFTELKEYFGGLRNHQYQNVTNLV